MISSHESLDAAMEVMEDTLVEWHSKPEGFLLYVDLRFAGREWFDLFQRRMDRNQHLRLVVTYGPSYYHYPACVRMYFRTSHEDYPLHPYNAAEQELSEIRRDERLQEVEQERRRQEAAHRRRAREHQHQFEIAQRARNEKETKQSNAAKRARRHEARESSRGMDE